ncbi:MAG: glycosyltransferase family 2 protein, partial [Atopobiaceae bacterium]|nr:glycosyltransferase family 2 protein [Atopobiaceae bacterium]
MDKTITFGIPCYNSASYMDTCINSILEGTAYAEDVQIVIVDDGSTKDETPAKVDEWAQRYPQIIKAVHQENGGHGIAVLTALANAEGEYFKVIDSDDWVDGPAVMALLEKAREFIANDAEIDLIITNYVYEHVEDNTHTIIDYRITIPRNRVITWNQIGRFPPNQNLLMHSLCYRTRILRAGGVPMPAHTFYVDNIYAYVPLPRCKNLYYLDVDLYRYYIGRQDQSVNEKVMVGRVSQQLRITRIMIHSSHRFDDVESPKLRNYMMGYLSLMMAVSSIFSKLSEDPDAVPNCDALWE